MFRVGFGYDNHRLVEGRDFVLGGLEIPSSLGADAHSDGDVVIHAIVDAMLGAIGAGDIGEHFPDSDPRWRGQSSRHFLEETARLIKERGWTLENVDTTIVLEAVRLGARKPDIVASLRSILAPYFELAGDAVSVKAKTNERCDAVGEGRAVVAHAAVLLKRVDSTS